MDHGRLNPDELVVTLAEKDSLLCEKDAVIALQQEQIAAQQAALDHAHEQLTLLKKALFAPRRERYVPSPDQQLLFRTLPLETISSDAAAAESVAVANPENPTPKPPRTPRRKFVIPDFLPVRREDHTLPDEQLPCGCCGGERVVIGTRVTKQIELEPAQAYVVEHVRHTYACPGCRAGNQVVTTVKPPVPIDKSPFGASLLAWIVSAKFERHLPTYRHQEMLVGPLGIWLSRPLLWKLLAGTAQCLKPIVALQLAEILKGFVVQADETPVRYLGGVPDKSSQGYLFGYRAVLLPDFRQ